MNTERLSRILLSPIVSEKSNRVGDAHNQVVFKVVPDASKPEIKRAVERMFSVEVESVQTMNYSGKRKGFARRAGRRPNWKKAYVCLKDGHEIDFMGAE